MAALINILLPVFIVAGISAFAYHKLEFDIGTLSKAAFYIFSPALVLDSLVNSDVSGEEFGWIALAVIATMMLLWGLGEGIARLLALSSDTRAAFLVSITSPNSANYGLPVVLFALGQAGLARAALYVTVNALMRSSFGVYLSARGSIKSPFSALRRVFEVPVIYAAAIGVILNLTGTPLPEPVIKAAHILGQGLVPASLVVLGSQIVVTFRERKQVTQKPALATAVFLRLVAAPLIAVLVCRLIGLEGLSEKVVILETATPTAVMSLVLATEFKTDVPFAALSILLTTLVSFATVAIWLNFYIM
ncbi:MAG: AEC family transporter [Anaerolineae bacterium]|nr:AEC family transporter [Anaerolineae bacterium]